jgi:hypothetical protein
MGPTPLMAGSRSGSLSKTFKANKPFRRLGARKPSKMAFTPPAKISAFDKDE